MFEYLGKEITLHKSLTSYLCKREIEGKSSKAEILQLFNEWPEKYLCETLAMTVWAISYIQEKTRTSTYLFREACDIDENIG